MHKPVNLYAQPARNQTIVVHPADYVLTEADQAQVGHGQALWILGPVLAKLRLLFATFRKTESMVYLLARKDNPHLIVGVLLPERQIATAASVKTHGLAVVHTSREARRRGFVIVAAAHSHALLPVFSSSVDIEYMVQLNQEGCGWSSWEIATFAGSVSRRPPAADVAASLFDIQFADQPALSVEITTSRHDLSADDLAVSLTRRDGVQVSSFLTLNAAGDAFFPVHKVVRCACCNGVTSERLISDLTVHVVGGEGLTAAEQTEFLAEARQRAPRSWSERWGANDGDDDNSGGAHRKHAAGVSRNRLDAPDADDAEPARAYHVTRDGRTRYVSPAVMEEAAYRCPALARALGWDEDDDTSTASQRERTSGQREGGQP